MIATTTTFKQLGNNCWLPIRFLGRCHQCQRFVTCKYPERTVPPEVQAQLDGIATHKAAIRQHTTELEAIERDAGLRS